GTVLLDETTGTVNFTPATDHTGMASFRYTVSDGRGGTASATVSLVVTPPDATIGLFAAGSTPAVAAVNDPGSVELGMKFTASAAGTVTGLRYYKSAQDTGTHTGSLWTAGGALL